MNSLWSDLAFFVIPGVHETPLVLESLPVAARCVKKGPQQLALAATIHFSKNSEINSTDFAVFELGAFTLVAPPARACLEFSWLFALSRRLGECWLFSTASGALQVILFRGGEEAARVDELTAPPPGTDLAGLTAKLTHEAQVLTALGRLLGVEEVKVALRGRGREADFCVVDATS